MDYGQLWYNTRDHVQNKTYTVYSILYWHSGVKHMPILCPFRFGVLNVKSVSTIKKKSWCDLWEFLQEKKLQVQVAKGSIQTASHFTGLAIAHKISDILDKKFLINKINVKHLAEDRAQIHFP